MPPVLRSFVRPSRDDTPRQEPTRAVTWSTQSDALIISARKYATEVSSPSLGVRKQPLSVFCLATDRCFASRMTATYIILESDECDERTVSSILDTDS